MNSLQRVLTVLADELLLVDRGRTESESHLIGCDQPSDTAQTAKAAWGLAFDP